MIVTDEWLDAEIAWYENRTTQHESLVKTYYALVELRDRRRHRRLQIVESGFTEIVRPDAVQEDGSQTVKHKTVKGKGAAGRVLAKKGDR